MKTLVDARQPPLNLPTMQVLREHDIDLAESYAYSNGDEDVPFLQTAGRARAINPGRELEKAARVVNRLAHVAAVGDRELLVELGLNPNKQGRGPKIGLPSERPVVRRNPV